MKEFALTIPGFGGTPIVAPSGVPTGGLFTSGQSLIQLIVGLFFVAAILLSLGYLIWAGVQWMMHGEKKENIAKVKTSMTFVVVGLTLVFLSLVVIRVIGYFFNIPLLP